MEINITQFFNEADAYEYSASRFERGENAGQVTWSNANEKANEEPMLTSPDELQAMRDWAKASGGWNKEEIAEWSDAELNALFVQLISGDMREIENLCTTDEGETDWIEYERLANQGTISGCLYRGDSGEIYYYLGM